VTDQQPPRWALVTALIAAVGALATSAYLTWAHYTEPTALSCPDTGAINCLKVTTSPQSVVLGVPVALLGLLFFAAMTLLTIPAAWRSRSVSIRSARMGGAVAGIGMVAYLVWVEMWQVEAICLWCTVVHVLAFVFFVAVLAGELLRDDEPAPDGSRSGSGQRRDHSLRV
jgi:uncharacterized membrane protein